MIAGLIIRIFLSSMLLSWIWNYHYWFKFDIIFALFTEPTSCKPTNPCQNGGKCFGYHYKIKCWCARGFGGPFCQDRVNPIPEGECK